MSGFTEFYAFNNGWSLFIDFGNGDGFCDIFVFDATSKLRDDSIVFTEEIQEWIDSVESVGKYKF